MNEPALLPHGQAATAHRIAQAAADQSVVIGHQSGQAGVDHRPAERAPGAEIQPRPGLERGVGGGTRQRQQVRPGHDGLRGRHLQLEAVDRLVAEAEIGMPAGRKGGRLVADIGRGHRQRQPVQPESHEHIQRQRIGIAREGAGLDRIGPEQHLGIVITLARSAQFEIQLAQKAVIDQAFAPGHARQQIMVAIPETVAAGRYPVAERGHQPAAHTVLAQ